MLFLAMMLAAISGDLPPLPPPPKPEPDPEPEPGSRVRLSDASGREVTLDGVEWEIGVDHAALPSKRVFSRNEPSEAKGTFTLYLNHPPRHRPLDAMLPLAPPRRTADPEKKRARKAQKKARRAGR